MIIQNKGGFIFIFFVFVQMIYLLLDFKSLIPSAQKEKLFKVNFIDIITIFMGIDLMLLLFTFNCY